jgi:hypothetical protein
MVIAVRFQFLGLLALLCALLAATPAWATSVLRVDVRTHLLDATAVIEGVVGESRQGLDESTGRPFTDTAVAVSRVLWGTAQDSITVRQPKGTVGDLHFGISGDGELRAGQRVVLFVAKGPGFHVLAALAQSVFEVHGSGDGATLSQQLDGLAFFTRDERGAIVPLETPVPGPATLGALKAELQAASEGR